MDSEQLRTHAQSQFPGKLSSLQVAYGSLQGVFLHLGFHLADAHARCFQAWLRIYLYSEDLFEAQSRDWTKSTVMHHMT